MHLFSKDTFLREKSQFGQRSLRQARRMSCGRLLSLLLLATVLSTVGAVPSARGDLRAARTPSHRRSLYMKKDKHKQKAEKEAAMLVMAGAGEEDSDSGSTYPVEVVPGDMGGNKQRLEDTESSNRLTLAGTKNAELDGGDAFTDLALCLGYNSEDSELDALVYVVQAEPTSFFPCIQASGA